MELLVTAHIHRPGISLWTNRFIFGDGKTSFVESSIEALPPMGMDTEQRWMKLAMMPVDRWKVGYGHTLKERDQALKPIQPPKPAPFFLPSAQVKHPIQASENKDEIDEPPSKRRKADLKTETEFIQNLEASGTPF